MHAGEGRQRLAAAASLNSVLVRLLSLQLTEPPTPLYASSTCPTPLSPRAPPDSKSQTKLTILSDW